MKNHFMKKAKMMLTKKNNIYHNIPKDKKKNLFINLSNRVINATNQFVSNVVKSVKNKSRKVLKKGNFRKSFRFGK
jgi:hypothetical protein